MERHDHERGHRQSHSSINVSHHDWHSDHYVNEWIDKDVTQDDERRPLIREMLAFAPFDVGADVRVLDVGGGYGVLSEEVLKTLPNARVVLQDYSQPMFDHARKRLAPYGDRVSYVKRDFGTSGWTEGIGGPFDLAVSGIAIHNLRDAAAIEQVYGSVFSILRPRGAFLDLDYVGSAGLDRHLGWLRKAGFAEVHCARLVGNQAMLIALRE